MQEGGTGHGKCLELHSLVHPQLCAAQLFVSRWQAHQAWATAQAEMGKQYSQLSKPTRNSFPVLFFMSCWRCTPWGIVTIIILKFFFWVGLAVKGCEHRFLLRSEREKMKSGCFLFPYVDVTIKNLMMPLVVILWSKLPLQDLVRDDTWPLYSLHIGFLPAQQNLWFCFIYLDLHICRSIYLYTPQHEGYFTNKGVM